MESIEINNNSSSGKVESVANIVTSSSSDEVELFEIDGVCEEHTSEDEAEVTFSGRPKKGRKRKIPGQSRRDRKKLYNNNKTHVNSKGNTVRAKIFDRHFSCSCPMKCTNTVNVEIRRRLFNQFWTMGTFAGRCVLLVTCVSKSANGDETYKIFDQEVCKRTLIRTLQIDEGRIAVALKKKQSDSYVDRRGQNSGGRNALPLAKKQEVRSHISSFPKYISHYTRNVTESKYLNADLNLAKMYRLYKDKFQNPVSLSVYKRIFYGNFNLRFKAPKKDTCKKCDVYKVKIKCGTVLERNMLEHWHNNHLEQAELLQKLMKQDLEEAKNNPFLEAATYDMMKTMSAPKVPTNIAYYKRQLNLYNQGIHIGSSGKGLFHVWLEYEASKGTQEVGSCLKKFISKINQSVRKLILWSDSCGGQNRSIKLVLMLIHVLQHHPTLEEISLRYLESGHTFLPNDSEFGDFECSLKKHERVYTDVAYMKIMKECRTDNKFEVIRMTSEDFFSVKNMEECIVNRKVDVYKQKINWLETHEILIDKFHPNIVKMKRRIDDDFQSVDIGKGRSPTDFQNVDLGCLYPNGRPLSKEKVDDLKEMMQLVPDEDKYFYSFLGDVTTGEFVDDVDGYGEELDFELEDE